MPVDQEMLCLTLLGNLVSNGIKFSEKGGVIRVTSKIVSKMLHFAVSDQGIGIEKEKLSKIFSSEGHTSSLGTFGESGTGFGLPIVEKVSKLAGGDVAIESSTEGENRGTRIYLSLPILEERPLETPSPKKALP